MSLYILLCVIVALSGVASTILISYICRTRFVRQQLEHEQEMLALKEQLNLALSDRALQPRMLSLQNMRSELILTRSQILGVQGNANSDKRIRAAFCDVLHLQTFSEFCITINSRLYGIMDKLQILYPGLSEQQYILLILYLLDLSTEDIAVIMCYQVSSMPNTKIRLAHKLGLSSGLLLQPHLLDLYNQSR